jgi:hypothetical protein
MKKTIVIIFVLIALLIVWKREPWVKTYPTKTACELANKEQAICEFLKCDNIITTAWLDCPHGFQFWRLSN